MELDVISLHFKHTPRHRQEDVCAAAGPFQEQKGLFFVSDLAVFFNVTLVATRDVSFASVGQPKYSEGQIRPTTQFCVAP